MHMLCFATMNTRYIGLLSLLLETLDLVVELCSGVKVGVLSTVRHWIYTTWPFDLEVSLHTFNICCISLIEHLLSKL